MTSSMGGTDALVLVELVNGGAEQRRSMDHPVVDRLQQSQGVLQRAGR